MILNTHPLIRQRFLFLRWKLTDRVLCFPDLQNILTRSVFKLWVFPRLNILIHSSLRTGSERLLSKKPVAIILTRDQNYHDDTIELAKKYGVALLKTTDGTSSCMSTLISYLSVELAPRITRHGVFVEVYGEGVLIMGESGMGKSETALELIKRGHRLVADDAVEIRKVSHKTLVGSAPENIRHFIELRGVGVVNARRLFGIGSVKVSEEINMVIQLEP